jgi:hypothetical protein
MSKKMIDQRLVRGLKKLFVIIFLIIGIVGGIGLLIYALYRVATFSKSIYAIIFYIALCCLIVFYAYKGIRKKVLSTVLLKLARVFMKILVILCIVSAIMLYGSLVVRYPIGGGIATPFLITLLLIGGLRFNIFSFFKKIF